MKFGQRGRDSDIQDRRGTRRAAIGGGLGLGGIVLVVAFALLTEQDPIALLGAVGGTGGGGPTPSPGAPVSAAEARTEEVVRAATTDMQDYWTAALPAQLPGNVFGRTQLVLFTDATTSGCGSADARTGPFYCPADRLVYLDLGFFSELGGRLGAPGEFAQAYVLAHEFGHHLQTLLGIDAAVRAAERADPSRENALSVATELQADCFAGVWGSSASQRGMLDAGDVEQGLSAAAAIGDDRLQRMAGRAVSPESFTHGSSAQRVEWFTRGLRSGDVRTCDTFGNGTLRP